MTKYTTQHVMSLTDKRDMDIAPDHLDEIITRQLTTELVNTIPVLELKRLINYTVIDPTSPEHHPPDMEHIARQCILNQQCYHLASLLTPGTSKYENSTM